MKSGEKKWGRSLGKGRRRLTAWDGKEGNGPGAGPSETHRGSQGLTVEQTGKYCRDYGKGTMMI